MYKKKINRSLNAPLWNLSGAESSLQPLSRHLARFARSVAPSEKKICSHSPLSTFFQSTQAIQIYHKSNNLKKVSGEVGIRPRNYW